MKLLAIDTATTLCGVAVLDLEDGRNAGCDSELDGGQGGARAAVRQQAVSTHSEMLLPLIAETLKELALSPQALSGVVCGAGPGSFTGLRIGIATAKGLCFALAVPLALVSSLRALGEAALLRSGTKRPVLATMNAFRGQVFARLVVPGPGLLPESLTPLLSAHPELFTDSVWDPEALAALLSPWAAHLDLCGGGLTSYPVLRSFGAAILDVEPAPHPLSVLRLGAARLRAGERDSLAAAPNYICASAAEENAAAALRASAPGI